MENGRLLIMLSIALWTFRPALMRHCEAVSREERTKDATWVGNVMDA